MQSNTLGRQSPATSGTPGYPTGSVAPTGPISSPPEAPREEVRHVHGQRRPGKEDNRPRLHHAVRSVMRTQWIRQMPVVEPGGGLVGIISLGDLNAFMLSEGEVEITFLHDYIEGKVR